MKPARDFHHNNSTNPTISEQLKRQHLLGTNKQPKLSSLYSPKPPPPYKALSLPACEIFEDDYHIAHATSADQTILSAFAVRSAYEWAISQPQCACSTYSTTASKYSPWPLEFSGNSPGHRRAPEPRFRPPRRNRRLSMGLRNVQACKEGRGAPHPNPGSRKCQTWCIYFGCQFFGFFRFLRRYFWVGRIPPTQTFLSMIWNQLPPVQFPSTGVRPNTVIACIMPSMDRVTAGVGPAYG